MVTRFSVLLGDARFRRYWSAGSVSAGGDGVSSVAVPMAAALLLRADPAQMGWLTALTWVPSVLFAIPAGNWVARHHRQPLAPMISADLVRCAAIASIPVAWSTGALSLTLLSVVTLVVATASVFFSVADAAVFPAIVAEGRVVAGQSLVYGARTVANTAGSGAGGLLVSLVAAPLVAAADALSYLWSAVMLARVGRPRSVPVGPPPSRISAAGMRFLLATPPLRAALGVTTTANFFNLMFHALLVLFLTRTLRLSPAVTGLVFAAEAAGAFLGSAFTPAIADRLGRLRSLMVGSLAMGVPLLVFPLSHGSPAVTVTVLVAGSFGSGIGRALQDISVAAIFMTTVPEPMRSPVRGAYQAISHGVRPLGALLGGFAGQWLGLRAAVAVAVAGGLLAFLWTLTSSRHKT
ncbi:MFS transporter [Winogradskya consettensis]|uniref:MFS transporter n=1 Tax=Winogradskya consettensis TaxID=113560 RepID=A0A919T283_9ACTN|nr:MFS transporter [Actinoplanes consettensis]GIM82150.1 MFS transporter [Actinoplanes consettensis]